MRSKNGYFGLEILVGGEALQEYAYTDGGVCVNVETGQHYEVAIHHDGTEMEFELSVDTINPFSGQLAGRGENTLKVNARSICLGRWANGRPFVFGQLPIGPDAVHSFRHGVIAVRFGHRHKEVFIPGACLAIGYVQPSERMNESSRFEKIDPFSAEQKPLAPPIWASRHTKEALWTS